MKVRTTDASAEHAKAPYWEEVSHHAPTDLFWMVDPLVRRRIGKLVANDPERGYPLDWFVVRMRDHVPFHRVLSVGCGTGGAERHLAAAGAASRITGIDVSAAPIEAARTAAAKAGLAGRIEYEVADVHTHLAERGRWNAIVFHESLHHLDRLPELFTLLDAALDPDGILYLDEYIGPSRDEWNWWRMIVPNLVYWALPRQVRRTKIVRPPVTDDDPTEMLRSSQIGPLVRERFDILEWRPYGGNLLSLIYPSLRRPEPGDTAAGERLETAVRRLIRAEDFLLRLPGARSFHVVVIARKRPLPL